MQDLDLCAYVCMCVWECVWLYMCMCVQLDVCVSVGVWRCDERSRGRDLYFISRKRIVAGREGQKKEVKMSRVATAMYM